MKREMLPETMKKFPEKDGCDLNLTETELTLGLPGGNRVARDGEFTGKATAKRGFSETVVDLKLGSSTSCLTSFADVAGNEKSAGKQSATKAQVVGWPPVRSYRANVMKICTYVKVAMDGAPYLRKIDLEVYDGYQQFLKALEKMFGCFIICDSLGEGNLNRTNGNNHYVATYEDKEGDWMLVGDVPWKMFAESCKRMHLMKSTEAIGLAPRTPGSGRCT